MDGWANAITKLGTRADPRTQTVFTPRGYRLNEDWEGLSSIFSESGMAKRIITAYPTAATRNWIRVTGDEDDEIYNKAKALRLKHRTKYAATMAQLYGGAYILIYANDGASELSEPLNISNIKTIDKLQVYDRTNVNILSRYGNNGATSLNADLPEYYQVTSPYSLNVATVHESRLIYIDGETVTPRQRQNNQGLGDSILVKVYDTISDIGDAYGNINNILRKFNTDILKINDLSNIIATGREQELKDRAEIMALTSSILKTIYIDGSEDFSRETSTLTGISDVLDRIIGRISVDTGIPEKILTGKISAGLSGDAAGGRDMEQWSEEVADYQEEKLTEPVQNIIDLIAVSKEIDINPREVEIQWNPVRTPSADSVAKTRKTVAESDKIYIDTGVLSPEEVRATRMQRDGYMDEVDEISEI